MSSGVAAIKDVSFAPTAGELIAGQYRVERVLGTGGMGVVLAATDTRTGEAVAIKLLRAAEERRAVDRFFREARAMSRLSTEHVVRVIEAGTADGRPYLVMERLEGKDFAEQARGGKQLPLREVVDATVQACEALSHAHRAGIVHRDLKPSNLFLHVRAGQRPVVKLLDFGISKVKSKEEWEKTLTATNDGGVLGSPPYMSPEQVRDPKKVDARSDVWALGIVMYKLLAGKLPFDGESVGEIFARVLERPYPSLRTWGGVDVPPELDAIVGRCLAKDRRERFQHTGELAAALAPFASPEWAELAQRLAARTRDDPPTIEDAGDTSGEIRPGSDPSTLTLETTDPGVGIPPPVAATPFEVTPPSFGGAASAAPSAPVPAVANTQRHFATSPITASATFGPAVIDPSLQPDAIAAATRRRRVARAGSVVVVLALLAAGAFVVAVRVRRGPAAVETSAAATTADAPPSASQVATAAPAASSAEPAPSETTAEATPPPPATTASARPTSAPPVKHNRPRRPPVSSGGNTTATAAAPAPSPPPTARPELHPNPYGQ